MKGRNKLLTTSALKNNVCSVLDDLMFLRRMLQRECWLCLWLLMSEVGRHTVTALKHHLVPTEDT